MRDRGDLDALAAYFAWAAWATVADRPGKDYSYTNNWPYEPLRRQRARRASTYFWSALSLVTLLGGLGLDAASRSAGSITSDGVVRRARQRHDERLAAGG